MQITTMHTLTFTMRASGNNAHSTALSIIQLGAEQLAVKANVMAMPLPPEEDSISRRTTVEITSENHERLENYWEYVSRSLSFIGVEAVSP